jgi:arsenate reductase
VPSGKLAEWAAKAGWEKLVNSRGPTWRKIADAEKRGLDESKALALLERNSSAIRRPIIEAGGRVLVGFDADEFARTF